MKKIILVKQGKVIEKKKCPQEDSIQAQYLRANAETRSLFNLLQSIVKKLLEQKEFILNQVKPELIHLSLIICEKVIRKELSCGVTLAKLIDAELLAATPHLKGSVVTIVLSPIDLILLEGNFDKISYDKKEINRVRFIADPHLCAGDFRIESEKALLNCSIQRELEDLKQKILRG